jgi:hypothetical protein
MTISVAIARDGDAQRCVRKGEGAASDSRRAKHTRDGKSVAVGPPQGNTTLPPCVCKSAATPTMSARIARTRPCRGETSQRLVSKGGLPAAVRRPATRRPAAPRTTSPDGEGPMLR